MIRIANIYLLEHVTLLIYNILPMHLRNYICKTNGRLMNEYIIFFFSLHGIAFIAYESWGWCCRRRATPWGGRSRLASPAAQCGSLFLPQCRSCRCWCCRSWTVPPSPKKSMCVVGGAPASITSIKVANHQLYRCCCSKLLPASSKDYRFHGLEFSTNKC